MHIQQHKIIGYDWTKSFFRAFFFSFHLFSSKFIRESLTFGARSPTPAAFYSLSASQETCPRAQVGPYREGGQDRYRVYLPDADSKERVARFGDFMCFSCTKCIHELQTQEFANLCPQISTSTLEIVLTETYKKVILVNAESEICTRYCMRKKQERRSGTYFYSRSSRTR